MKIIIEIEGGIVAGVYKSGRCNNRTPNVVVIDLDVRNVGSRCEPHHWTPMPISEADKTTRRLVK